MDKNTPEDYKLNRPFSKNISDIALAVDQRLLDQFDTRGHKISSEAFDKETWMDKGDWIGNWEKSDK